ncbi:nucleotidyltransferase family protein [Alkalilimnicola sp. S0819]|uniref:nucleotidyltransferase family protein n=1 Tax=Alkalilimnicola sp. S0819 TaxID=2613922 RepID=UPI0012619358|nr:nucleotidyltransferase family protein [Alkalilimnicola sp. S0819]KAB7628236.1 NTP transferase domain-containing protein [Alkalilimnicola sp. S0819]MPQ15127.1 NTP transferase domain-containing protein [Alkalilimnicola sp. S0819]
MKHSLVLTEETTLKEAIEALDQGGVGFLAMVEATGRLVGILTDGDIRRAVLRKEDRLLNIINTSPETMLDSASQREIVLRLKALHRRHMPLVDAAGRFSGVFSLDDVEFVSRDNTVVIMSGGLGSRLGELTKEVPKPMLTVGSRPMLQHLVEMFSEHGFRRFIFCVNYKREVIQDYFGDGSRFGVKIDYVVESKRLGTAGALSLIDAALDCPFFVINGDVLANVDFSHVLATHIASARVATMCVRQHSYQVPYGVVRTDASNMITGLQEKPELAFDVNAGIYVLDPEVLDLVPCDTFYDMPSLFECLVGSGRKAGVYRIEDYWLDVGRREDLQKANRDLPL